MNPDAFNILKRYNLPTPRIIQLEEIKREKKCEYLYLRYSDASGKRNEVVATRAIQSRIKEIHNLMASGDLLYIEATYNSKSGGASLLKNGFNYSEFVEGHSISLLRRGLCGARILDREDKGTVLFPRFQGWRAKQSTSYTWLPEKGPDLNRVTFISRQLKALLPYLNSTILVEWMETEEGIIFCDAKIANLDEFGNSLYLLADGITEIPIFHTGQGGKITKLQIDCFDIDNNVFPAEDVHLIAVNSAILCHYAVRSVNYRTNITLRIGYD